MAKQRPEDTSQQPEQQPDFERALERLEEIVHLLEEGEIGLGEALARYEEGVKLLRQAYDLLERAERRIELLSGVDAEGNPVTRPVDDQATLAPAEQPPRRQKPRGKAGGGGESSRKSQAEGDDSAMDAPGGLF